MFGLGEASARELKVDNYVTHLNQVLADIRQAPLAAQRPASVNAAEQQFLQFSDKAIEYSPFDQMTEVEFAEFIQYGDDTNQAMNVILSDLTPSPLVDRDEPPVVAGAKPKFDVGKLVAGLTVVGVLGYVVWKYSKPSPRPVFAGLGGDDPTWENRFGVPYPKRVSLFNREEDEKENQRRWHTGPKFPNPMPHLPATTDNSEVVARLLKTKEWRGSTAVDMGDVIEVRHPSGAVARINKKRPEKKRGRR